MTKEWTPKGTLAQKLNVLICCDGLLLLLESSRRVRGEERTRERYIAFILHGEISRAEWYQSFSLDEIYKFETSTTKTIPPLNNNLKFFLSATPLY